VLKKLPFLGRGLNNGGSLAFQLPAPVPLNLWLTT
jgi:hypothetical protein